MKDLLKSKAENCPHFRDSLIQSGTKILAEATSNTFWATGLDVRTTSMTKPEYWPGSNMLGMMLMDLRDCLLQDQVLPNQSEITEKTQEKDDTQQIEIATKEQENDDSQSDDEEEDDEVDISFSPSKTKDQANNDKSSFLKKVSSIFKQPQANTMDKYVTSVKKNKRRQSTTPPKPSEKKAKTDAHSDKTEETASYKEHQKMPQSETANENTNHKPGNK